MSALFCVVRVSDGVIVGASAHSFGSALEDAVDVMPLEAFRVAKKYASADDVGALRWFEANGYRLARIEVTA